MLCLCAAQLKSWFQTDLGRKKSASYYRQKRQLLLTFLTMVTLYVQFLCSDWLKFDRWVHAEIYTASWNLFTSTAEADGVYTSL